MPNNAGDPAGPMRSTRTPKCSRCRNHGLVVPVRGHSGRCAWKMCTCPKCALITERHKILAAHKQLRKLGSRGGTPERSGVSAEVVTGEHVAVDRHMDPGERRTEAGHPHPDIGPSLLPLGCAPNSDYFERDTSRMYLGCPPMYHYPPFTMGLAVSQPRYRSPAPPAGIPIRAVRQYHPLNLQDTAADLQPNYYPPVPPFIPHGFIPGMHYLPPPLPMSVNMMAEPSRDILGNNTAENQNIKPIHERSQNKEPSA
ncbi:doublesex- and mab-3-related transcription factor B1 [Pelodytes ibericus]